MSKIKTENFSLKDKERNYKQILKETEQEREDFKASSTYNDKLSQELQSRVTDLERDLQLVLYEREKELRESTVRESVSTKNKENEKVKMMDDIKNMIHKFKVDKKIVGASSSVVQGNFPKGSMISSPKRESSQTHYYSMN
jgi:hypothetical protein